MKVSVTERALFARVSRHLAKEGTQLKRCSPNTSAHAELGDYFTVRGSAVNSTKVNLDKLARQLGLLRPYERLEDPV